MQYSNSVFIISTMDFVDDFVTIMGRTLYEENGAKNSAVSNKIIL